MYFLEMLNVLIRKLEVYRVCVVIGAMASPCSLSSLFPLQSQLDCDLEEAASPGEKEELVLQYLRKLEESDDLKVPDFEEGGNE